MKSAQRIFRFAGIYGLLAVAPMYFLEQRIAQDQPPAITHPEYFYGFIGVTLAAQLMFLVISTDPARYRAVMLPAMVEKFSFVASTFLLYAAGRAPTPIFAGAVADLLLG